MKIIVKIKEPGTDANGGVLAPSVGLLRVYLKINCIFHCGYNTV